MLKPITKYNPPARTFGRTVLCAVEFGGADPTGKVDSTAAFQKAIDALPAAGGTISVPAGTFLIDPVVSIKFRSNMCMSSDSKTVFKVIANSAIRYGVFQIRAVKNVLVTGGTIMGDRDTHDYTTTGTAKQNTHEWGHAIQVYGSSKVTIRDITLRDCTGDGISASSTRKAGSTTEFDPCDDVVIYKALITNNRRQGISIVKATNVTIKECEISHIVGTAPECAIDIEPESNMPTDNIVIEDCHLHHCRSNGILVLQRSDVVNAAITNIHIRNNTIEHNAYGIYSIRVTGLNVTHNMITNHRLSGFYIGPESVDVYISENTFGYNYHRDGAVLDRVDDDKFGQDTSTGRDVQVRNTDANQIGKNYYL